MQTPKPVIAEQTFNTSKDKLWEAITDPNQMRQWFFDNIPAFKPEAGFKTQFNVFSGERDFMHIWKVTEVVPKQKISLNWSYEGYPGESYVTFEILEQEDQIKLRVTHKGVESFPQDIPEFTRESCLGGWNYFIKEQLPEYLKNG